MAFIFFLAVLVAMAVLAPRYGRDSRRDADLYPHRDRIRPF